MTLHDFIVNNNCENFQHLKERLSTNYPALKIETNRNDISYIISLNPRVENFYPSVGHIITINGIGFGVKDDNINGFTITNIKSIKKNELESRELFQLFNHTSDVFNDTFDFQVKYGLMTRDEMFTQPPYFIQKDNLKMKIGHLKEELAEIENAAENGDIAEFADGIIDLIYVAAGLGNLCRLPMHQLWNDVQNSNMVGKERVTSLDNATKRGSTFDVRKTTTWVGPRGKDIIEEFTKGK